MRDHVRAFCAAVVEAFEPQGRVLEFGARRVAGQDETADLRSLFPGREYVGCDAHAGTGVDRVDDISRSSFAAESAGTIVCVETLEHVFAVHDAFSEMHRVIQPGGLLVVTTPMRFPIHDYPEDYWRMTPACINRLASAFPFRVVGSQGCDDFPHTVYLAALKAPVPTDAGARAERLIALHTRWLAQARASRPLAAKLHTFVKSLYRSKGERRELANTYVARFAIDDERA
jgi:SAM-dependent methyltransferase